MDEAHEEVEEQQPADSGRRVTIALIVGGVAVAGLIVAAVVAKGSGSGYPLAPPPGVRSTIDSVGSNVVKNDSAGPDPKYAEVVLTSEVKALSIGAHGDRVTGSGDQPVYLVQIPGDFVASDVPLASGGAPTGKAWVFMVNPRTGGTTDLGLNPKPENLGTLGVVTQVPLPKAGS